MGGCQHVPAPSGSGHLTNLWGSASGVWGEVDAVSTWSLACTRYSSDSIFFFEAIFSDFQQEYEEYLRI